MNEGRKKRISWYLLKIIFCVINIGFILWGLFQIGLAWGWVWTGIGVLMQIIMFLMNVIGDY